MWSGEQRGKLQRGAAGGLSSEDQEKKTTISNRGEAAVEEVPDILLSLMLELSVR